MFQRQGAVAVKKDLTNIRSLCEALGNPQDRVRFVHIAGTNGKGSVTHILAALLGESLEKVGIYTSPHFQDYRERIKVGANYISHQAVIQFMNDNYELIQALRPSFFEITVAMAFWWFDKENVDIAVIETGLGGRLDSTNIIQPVLSVITNISYDHQDFLGESLEEIAAEKAGIIKKSIPVVIGRKDKSLHDVFIRQSMACESDLSYSEDLVDVISKGLSGSFGQYLLTIGKRSWAYESDLVGHYQLENMKTALSAYEVLLTLLPGLKQEYSSLLKALKHVGSRLSFRGRWQILNDHPLVIADGAHNLEAISKAVAQLKQLNYDRLVLVLGFVRDKDVFPLLSLFPEDAHFIFTQADIPRALPVGELSRMGDQMGLSYSCQNEVASAYREALRLAQPNDVVFIGGSLYILAEILPE